MSLDVWLIGEVKGGPTRSIIFVREDGETREISRAEWDAKYPGSEPAVVETADELFEANITHNLGKMADAGGIYRHLWRPDELGITRAAELIDPLAQGLSRLRAEPDEFRKHNPPNGWGSYETLVRFVDNYLNACRTFPEATVHVSR